MCSTIVAREIGMIVITAVMHIEGSKSAPNIDIAVSFHLKGIPTQFALLMFSMSVERTDGSIAIAIA
ncbi:hypothetical protein SDC9_151930 [bioreactor metagenome]|uniref:Uncharacterized protein n=1 Tax=bioreactor metagenome TaxID=1076179 RepID=A0A645ERP8_9ZZZZ